MYRAKAIIFGIFIHSGMGITFLPLLFQRWKSNQKIFTDGKCHRTGPYAPTVGPALARSTMASCVGTHRMRPHASSGLRAGQQPTGFGRKEISW